MATDYDVILEGMPLMEVFRMMFRNCGKSTSGIMNAAGYSPSHWNRIFDSNEDYWPSLLKSVDLMRACSSTLLLDWMRVQVEAGGGGPKLEEMDCEQLVRSLGAVFARMGRLAESGGRAVSDGEINKTEARDLIRKLLDLINDSLGMLNGLRPLAGRGIGE